MNERQQPQPRGPEQERHEAQKHNGPDAEPTHEREEYPHPQVWIGSLADYNNGILTGEWVDAAVDGEDLVAAARGILGRGHEPDAEEWAIFDYDGFGDWRPGQHELLELVAEVARGIAEHGPVFAAWADFTGADPEQLAQFNDAYLGHYDSAEDLARDVMGDLGIEADIDRAVPASLRPYVQIDYAQWAKDCFLDGDLYFADDPEGGVWVFDQRP